MGRHRLFFSFPGTSYRASFNLSHRLFPKWLTAPTRQISYLQSPSSCPLIRHCSERSGFDLARILSEHTFGIARLWLFPRFQSPVNLLFREGQVDRFFVGVY